MKRAICIGFHNVVEDNECLRPIASGHTTRYTIRRSQFRQHLEAIVTAVGPDRLTRIRRLGEPLSSGRVALTIDDGGQSSYTCVAEELERLGCFGHFFITTNWTGTSGFLDRSQIRELRQRGHVIGSHSCSHPERMCNLTDSELFREWQYSTAFLADLLGQPVTTASVPGGYYARNVAEAAAKAGIEILFSSVPTTMVRMVDGCRILGRYSIDSRTTPGTAASIAMGKFWPRLEQRSLWSAKSLAKLLGGRRYLSVRRWILTR